MLQSTGSQSQTRLSDWTVTARNFIYFKCDSIKAFKSDLMCLYSISHILCMLSCFSHVRLFVTLWTVACQTPLSVGFSMQEYWSGLPCPPPGDLSNPRIEPAAPSLPLSHWESPGKVYSCSTQDLCKCQIIFLESFPSKFLNLIINISIQENLSSAHYVLTFVPRFLTLFF